MTVQINDKVLRVLQAEKISADELYHMLDEVAFTSLRGCNRRYFQWLFLMKDNTLQDMQRVELVEVGRGPHRMLEEHEACNGEGCRPCGWIGQVSRAIEDTTERAMHAAR
jgi:hypothetical protein